MNACIMLFQFNVYSIFLTRCVKIDQKITNIDAALSPSLSVPAPFGATKRLRLATPTGLSAALSLPLFVFRS